MPDAPFRIHRTAAIPADLRQAHTMDLLRYIEEDTGAIRYRAETGKWIDGIDYDIAPSKLIAAYAAELHRRGL